GQFFEYAIAGGVGTPPEDFDEDKVNDLKDALLGALKNASHLRMVKPEEYITVVVQGTDAGTIMNRTSRDGKTSVRVTTTSRPGSSSNARRTESVLTMRVQKSDVDAFANG